MPIALSLDAMEQFICAFMERPGKNRVAASDALRPDLDGFLMYGPPLAGVAAADDPLFARLRVPDAVGPHFRLPEEWLPGAASVVSLFFPYAAEVTKSNGADSEWASDEWLHARIEGQEMIDSLAGHLAEEMRRAGWRALAPSIHPGFQVWRRPPGTPETEPANPTSNWSERHVAHVAGLGTFGMSHALITPAGAAGRLTSVITDMPLPPTPRDYTRHDEYCTRCGACAPRCPVDAIRPERGGKDKRLCMERVDLSRARFAPRYGCGKCYTAVPCERRAPGRHAERGAGK